MLPVITFLWKRPKTGYPLPFIVDYSAEHVNILQSMLKRHLHISHELICITDMPEGVKCRTIPLWDKCKQLGGCFNRLYMFSDDMKELLGPRFVAIDLDVVIVDDVTPVFTRKSPFLIHRYVGNCKEQKYNGAFMMMNSGIYSNVWESFDPNTSPWQVLEEREQRRRVGSDQAWISMQIPDAETIGVENGLYEAARIEHNLPPGAKMVFFSGKRDPSLKEYTWVKEHYH